VTTTIILEPHQRNMTIEGMGGAAVLKGPGENTASIRRRLSTSTYYRPWADQLLTTRKYQVRMLRALLP
jgi:hypothetical protein